MLPDSSADPSWQKGILGYTVAYDKPSAVTGTASADSAIYLNGETVIVSTAKPYTKEGYTQTGWSSASNTTDVATVNKTIPPSAAVITRSGTDVTKNYQIAYPAP
ncbi:hypothetical protein RX717_12060 [Intestinibacillus sp. NTUH-41-i26]|uniref:hypothetical protein n=1 Tax=Butyricicoccaceae TaxID=3085642 RepID=UPI00131E99F2|nr:MULTISPECIES: hypothetical protein [Butyricicoccaceae]WOC74713.1 hypothetical protein RX717_12060 [Intestinibacillus sp. NTUH-41-i26]